MFTGRNLTRIAPTPSGFLHLGNAFSFAVAFAVAEKFNANIFLRIDDLDNTRFREEYVHDIFDTLNFLRFPYTHGPKNALEFNQKFSQHLRLKNYENALQKLAEKKLVYACVCSRKLISENTKNIPCPNNCEQQNISLNTEDVAWRIRIPANTIIRFKDYLLGDVEIDLSADMPGFVVRRKDGIPAYQLASLCDDLHFKTNIIVRGEDLLHSTAAQIFLADLLEEESFPKAIFFHHNLITDISGSKLSKSHEALSICELRKAGKNAAQIWEMIGALSGFENIRNAAQFCRNYQVNLM